MHLFFIEISSKYPKKGRFERFWAFSLSGKIVNAGRGRELGLLLAAFAEKDWFAAGEPGFFCGEPDQVAFDGVFDE